MSRRDIDLAPNYIDRRLLRLGIKRRARAPAASDTSAQSHCESTTTPHSPRNVIFRQLRLGNPMIGEHALIRRLGADLPPAPRPQLIDFQNRIVQVT